MSIRPRKSDGQMVLASDNYIGERWLSKYDETEYDYLARLVESFQQESGDMSGPTRSCLKEEIEEISLVSVAKV
ncbi:unnamed protein product [Arabis nemorensis]|uniref:Uncharacterized protein n=1 Tax=Arabis nemorensis TaxID=586526 RepID=A0A565BUA5_9BRAS|nr:unnamed protein product [Arabis nemorensis]